MGKFAAQKHHTDIVGSHSNMAFKLIVLMACVLVAHAIVLPQGILTKRIEVEEAPAKYTFSYQVNDPKTGDIKSQEESRDGDVVKGVYALIDPDGQQRVVQYTSDGINGFNAVVSRTPIGKQIAVAPAVPIIKTLQPTIIKSIPSLIQSPLIKTSSLGLPLGLDSLYG